MHKILTLVSLALFLLLLVLENWTLSLVSFLLLSLFLWTRFFSKRVILNNFRNKKALKSTSYFRKQKIIDQVFFSTPSQNYLFSDRKNLQFYILSDQPLSLAFSETLLKNTGDEDFADILKSARFILENNKFAERENLVALFLLFGSFFRRLDAIICFIFGIKTHKGEPKMLTRLIISPFLNWLCSILSPQNKKKKVSQQTKGALFLKESSYLSLAHHNPLLNPVSATDFLTIED